MSSSLPPELDLEAHGGLDHLSFQHPSHHEVPSQLPSLQIPPAEVSLNQYSQPYLLPTNGSYALPPAYHGYTYHDAGAMIKGSNQGNLSACNLEPCGVLPIMSRTDYSPAPLRYLQPSAASSSSFMRDSPCLPREWLNSNPRHLFQRHDSSHPKLDPMYDLWLFNPSQS